MYYCWCKDLEVNQTKIGIIFTTKIKVGLKKLEEIKADKIPQIVVYNKVDRISKPFEVPKNAVLISAKNNVGIDTLKEMISQKLFEAGE